jgi:hypothetical protein
MGASFLMKIFQEFKLNNVRAVKYEDLIVVPIFVPELAAPRIYIMIWLNLRE